MDVGDPRGTMLDTRTPYTVVILVGEGGGRGTSEGKVVSSVCCFVVSVKFFVTTVDKLYRFSNFLGLTTYLFGLHCLGVLPVCAAVVTWNFCASHFLRVHISGVHRTRVNTLYRCQELKLPPRPPPAPCSSPALVRVPCGP